MKSKYWHLPNVSTIDLILCEEKLSKNELDELRKQRIVNECGAKGWVNFSSILKHNICLFPEFKKEKLSKLIEDLWYVCSIHDLYYYKWNNILNKIKADYKISKYIFHLLDWTSLWNRLAIVFIVFIWLLRYWGDYFNRDKKKNLINK